MVLQNDEAEILEAFHQRVDEGMARGGVAENERIETELRHSVEFARHGCFPFLSIKGPPPLGVKARGSALLTKDASSGPSGAKRWA